MPTKSSSKPVDQSVLIQSILGKFGSISNLAKKMGTSHQNVSNKIRRQGPKFLAQLAELGIVFEGVNNGAIIGKQKGEIRIESSEIEQLKLENAHLKKLCSSYEKQIKMLEDIIARLDKSGG